MVGLTPTSAASEAQARYVEPVDRVGHFALGRPHEYATLELRDADGRIARHDLPDDEVFEDLAPRPVRLTAGADPMWLAIVSHRTLGARLVLFEAREGDLVTAAESAPIGTPRRWLNPVGVADLDGDGQAEIAAVITPHIGGILKVYRRQGRQLVELASAAGFSNHVLGSTVLGLSTIAPTPNGPRLVVPSMGRQTLRVMALQAAQLVQTASCPLPAPLRTALVRHGRELRVAQADGMPPWSIPPGCLR